MQFRKKFTAQFERESKDEISCLKLALKLPSKTSQLRIVTRLSSINARIAKGNEVNSPYLYLRKICPNMAFQISKENKIFYKNISTDKSCEARLARLEFHRKIQFLNKVRTLRYIA